MAGATALQGVRDAGKVRHGTRLLINGAGRGGRVDWSGPSSRPSSSCRVVTSTDPLAEVVTSVRVLENGHTSGWVVLTTG